MLVGKQPPAGVGFMIAGWRLAGGAVRPAHFMGVHAQQIIPFAGLVLHRFVAPYALAAVGVFSIAYVSAWLLLARLGLSAAGVSSG